MASWDEQERRIKVVLAISHKDLFVTLEWAEAYNRLLLPPPFSVIHRRGPLPIDAARNELVEEALKEDPEYILFWDNDVIVPPDAVYKLMAHNYPIVSILYPDKPGRACAFRLVNGKLQPVPWNELQGKVAFVDAVGFGMVLIDARVFKLMKKKGIWPPFRYEYHPTYNPEGVSEDQYFCLMAKKLGFSVLVDGRIVGQHVFTGKLVDDRRITYLVP